jgi:hypothetical protein
MSELAQLPTPTTAILIFLILESRHPSRDPYTWARCIFALNENFRPRLTRFLAISGVITWGVAFPGGSCYKEGCSR